LPTYRTLHLLTELAEIEIVRGYSSIARFNQMRAITVTAGVDETRANSQKILKICSKKRDTGFVAILSATLPIASNRQLAVVLSFIWKSIMSSFS